MEKTTEIINGKSRIVATFNINWNGKDAVVKIKKLNFGEFNEVQRASAKLTMFGGAPKLDIDAIAMNENAILRSLVDAPFPINIEEIRQIEKDVAEEILTNVNELNNPTDKKKDN